MSVGLVERPVAKDKRIDTSIRVDVETAEGIKKVATLRGITISEYMRAIVLPIVKRDLVNEGKKLIKGDKSD